jgi:hypothetical protein
MLSLERHPESRGRAVRSVRASVRASPQSLSISYVIEGELAAVKIPAPRPPRRAERLWQHTCCELFIARKSDPAYHELNFSPSGEWALYQFARYREPAPLAVEGIEPEIRVRRGERKFELEALVKMHGFGCSLALAAVIEEHDGALSYWALKHAPGKPDFHQRDAFALELDEIRH